MPISSIGSTPGATSASMATAASTAASTATTGTGATTASPATGTSGTGAAGAGSTAGLSTDPTKAQFGKDTFLKLLVAQLRFQNPLSPTDGTQYIAQTAQFTMVETLQEIAKSSSDAAIASASQTATSMVGKEIAFVIDGKAGSGVVAAAQLDRTGPTVLVGKQRIPIAAVTEVRTVPAATTPTGSAASTAPTPPTAGFSTGPTPPTAAAPPFPSGPASA